MSISLNSNAIAVCSGDGWILQPVCGDGTANGFQNAVAVRSGGEWVMTPTALAAAGENAFAIRGPGGEVILLPIGCPQAEDPGEEPCAGDDPRCGDCDCAAELAETYTVTISGFPAICTVEKFNGAWTVTWDSDCLWIYDIDASHRVTLSLTGGGLWRVNWRVTAPGGASGYYTGSGSPACSPLDYTWSYDYCFNPFGCFNMCSSIQTTGAVTVSA